MKHKISLGDDGTTDTVFACTCGEELGYDGEAFERDESGALIDEPAALAAVLENHLGDLAQSTPPKPPVTWDAGDGGPGQDYCSAYAGLCDPW